jgi:hypothetical protein
MTRVRIAYLLAALVLLPLTGEAHKVGAVDYSGWTQPRNGGSCCGGIDCAPVPPGSLRRESDNTFSVYRYGVWTHFTADQVLSFASPDGQVHACMSLYQGQFTPLCLALPGGD